jgi:WASH complex subunit FAM21
MDLLDELEAKARQLTASDPPISSSAHHQSWSLADDARLATFVQEFTVHIQRRVEEIADAVLDLEDKAGRAALSVELAKSAFLTLPDERFVEQVVGDLGDNSHDASASDHGPESSVEGGDEQEEEERDAELNMQRLEEEAIQDGMKALSIFYDPASAVGGEADHYFGLDPVDDSACYYDSAPADQFNQRPLPFVVGSREFLESTDAGLGDDFEEDDTALENSPGTIEVAGTADNTEGNDVFTSM